MNRAKWVLAIAACISAGSVPAAERSIDLREAWKGRTDVFAQAALPGAGFSFRHQGKVIGPEISPEWRRTVSHDDRSGISTTVFTHASGLVVTRAVRAFPAFGAIEYRVSFKNTAAKKLEPVSAIQALNMSMGRAILDGNCVVSSGGGLADGFLPPRTFAIRMSCFAPTVPDDGAVALTTEGGRSSNRDLPFFFIQNDSQHAGMFVAFGWSGQWTAVASLDRLRGTVELRGSIPGLKVALEPGEEIPGPTVLLGLYQGALTDGSNQLRRLIRDVYTPKLAGNRVLPIATYDHWYNIEEDFDESLLKKLADAAAAIHQEYFMVDAAWYAGASKQEGFSAGLGNWYQIDKQKLPRGLKAVADYVRSKNLKFGLWFEPERVAENSRLAREHPDWILWEHGDEHQWWSEFSSKKYGLLDYGRPDAWHWVRDMMDRYIRDYGIQYVKYDFNIDPLPYWNAHDKPDRQGITQLKHVQGFYALIDWLREHHPDIVLEDCASGGRRIDLETARRFHTFWISDYTVDPAIVRFHLFGIQRFLPGNYHYIQYTLPSPYQKAFQADDLSFQSLFGGAFGTGGRIDLWSQAMQQRARLHIETWKKLRRYLIEDYYPLSKQPGDLQSWSGWQFQDPKDHSGFVQTFRTRTPDTKHRFVLQKLDEKTRYRFTDIYSGRTFDVDGATAMTGGIEVSQDPMSSRILTYGKSAQ
jgi:alpha-galactosidase